MAITEQQKALRARRIGSSDAGRVMAGDWLALWREKTGRAEPANLDLVAAVQIGIATEHLHPRFIEHATGVPCVAAGETYAHAGYEWLVAHPDFLTWDGVPAGTPDTLIEAKFSGGFQSDADLAHRYHWQLQHQFLATGWERGLLSILRPSGHSLVRVRRSEIDCERLLSTLQAFWWYVANDVEPSDPMPVDAPEYETLRVVDMARHNRFVSLAAVLVERRPMALEAREAEAALKALMPADAKVAFVAGLYLARDREGRLSLRYGAPPKRALDRAELWEPATVSTDPSLSVVLDGGWGEGRDQSLV
ncbi:MAG TPA: YqaJ viral recombinase family protein [Azospirillum sp.]|nr:YqaJ viral recombinase family protein [Azospirillum sp.]